MDKIEENLRWNKSINFFFCLSVSIPHYSIQAIDDVRLWYFEYLCVQFLLLSNIYTRNERDKHRSPSLQPVFRRLVYLLAHTFFQSYFIVHRSGFSNESTEQASVCEMDQVKNSATIYPKEVCYEVSVFVWFGSSVTCIGSLYIPLGSS